MARGDDTDRDVPRAHFGGPDRPPRYLRDLLEARVDAVEAGGAIDWMTYYFRDERLADALVRARRRGVAVRVCLEGSPRLIHANDAVIARLREGIGPGLRVVHGFPSHLHAKLYCFRGDRQIALVGSFNPSGNEPGDPAVVAVIGDQDRGHNLLVETADPALITGFLERIEAVHAGAGSVRLALGDSGELRDSPHGMDALFFPSLAHGRLVERLAALEGGASLRIAASHVRDGHIARCLAGLVRRGISVTLFTGHTRRRTPPRMERYLSAHGIAVRRFVHPDGLPMHCKFILAESRAGNWAAFGSYNLTRTSRWLNQELLIFSENPALWSAFDARWREIVSKIVATNGGCEGGAASPERPLSILMVDSHARIEWGGAIQCARLAAALAARGHRVTCVFDGAPPQAPPPPQSEWQRLAAAGVTVLHCRLTRAGAIRQFRKVIATSAPDIVHTHKNRALRFVAAATAGERRFAWVANRGTAYSLLPGSPVWAIHRFLVDRIIAVSDAVRDRLRRDGIPAHKLSIILGSFDTERFRPGIAGESMRARWGVPAGAPLIGMAASFRSYKKGHGDFLHAAKLVLTRHPEAHFVILGDGRSGRVRRRAEQLRLGDRVHFPGFVTDMPAALAAIDVVVCASVRGEGLSGAVREALAMARPVVSTDVAGNRELVRHGETGLLTPVRDPAALAEAVSALLDRPTWAGSLAAAGRALVLDLCTNQTRARLVEELYRELIAKTAPAVR